ncbi:TolC family protein [Chitinophaga sp. Cy-1792]|uniref:TolC family protein n=1 Tax=Chitinophaga sp. Cy-1792 TaxID=2608339 RepID=UPI00141EE5FF|nr:TolC family protein [Chitinophaga sp. Cy-1792]NIG56217.1 TolC family protein [Chitinophaga sp. Cy-1792]
MKIFMNVKIYCVALLCLAATTGKLFAQQPADSFSLHKAIDRTLAHYPTLKAKAATVQAGQASLTDVKHNWYPNLKLHEQLDLGTDNSIYGSYFTLGMIPSTSGGIREENTSQAMSGNIAMAEMQWEIYNFGAYRTQKDAAKSALRVNSADMANEANQLTAAIIQDYLELLRLEQLRKIQQDNINRTAEIQRAVNAIVKHGLKPGVDSAVAAAELSRARLNLIDVNSQYNRVRIEIASFTGMDTTGIIPDTINETRLLALLNEYLPEKQQMADSLGSHPLLQYYNAQYLNQLANAQVTRKSNLPKVSLMAAGWMRGSSGEYNDYFNKNLWSGLGYSRSNYLVGLGITYNLTDIKHTRERVAVQQYKAQAAEQEMETARTRLQQSLDQAQSDMAISEQRLEEIPAQLNAARAAATQKTALYKAGLTNIIEVTNALFLLNRAETDLVQARDIAWKALFRAAYAGNSIQQLLPELN